MKRLTLIAVIGYIIGILWGLYFTKSIVLFYILIAVFYISSKKFLIQKQIQHKFKLFSFKRYFRYIKLVINQKVICLLILCSIISNTIVIFQNKQYEATYQDQQEVDLVGIIEGNQEEKEYYDRYRFKVIQSKNQSQENTYLYLQVSKKEKNQLLYGDKIHVKGTFQKPQEQRNKGGFNYQNYLKTIKIHGSIRVTKLEKMERNQVNPILSLSNFVSIQLKKKIGELFGGEEASMLQGLLLGDTSQIEEELKQEFRVANISHVLAVSGMHISYLILGVQLVFQKLLGKQKTKIVMILFLLFYLFLTGFTPSVVRATIMGILFIFSGILYRKNDIATSLSFSLLCILLENPFSITHVGLQLSYLGTIGIVVFQKTILKLLERPKKRFQKKHHFHRKKFFLIHKLKEIIAVTLSAQVIILPIMLYHFNQLGIYFLITNLFLSIFIGPLIIFATFIVILSFPFLSMMKLVTPVISTGIQALIQISHMSQLPFAKIYISTPNPITIFFYFIILFLFYFVFKIYQSSNSNPTMQRFRNLIALFRYQFSIKRKKIVKILLLIFLFFFILLHCFSKDLKIHFVDVGQGDCTFITTPNNKTIIIDGGGSMDYDVGKNTLLPYLLDRGYRKIDYLMISHFDQDHCRSEC